MTGGARTAALLLLAACASDASARPDVRGAWRWKTGLGAAGRKVLGAAHGNHRPWLAPVFHVHGRRPRHSPFCSRRIRGRAGIAQLQPPPKRTFDPNFNSDTETYEGQVAFLLELEIEKNASAGPVQIRRECAPTRRAADKQCVRGGGRGTANLTVDAAQRRRPWRFRRDTRRLSPPMEQGTTGRRVPLVSAWSRSGSGWPPSSRLASSDDSHHHVLLPQAVRRAGGARASPCGGLCWEFIVLFSRAGLLPQPCWGRSAW